MPLLLSNQCVLVLLVLIGFKVAFSGNFLSRKQRGHDFT